MLNQPAWPRRRRGHSLLEMLVSLLVGAILIAGVGSLGFRQQRFHRDIVAVTERVEELEQAAALLPIALRAVAPSAGDIPTGAARDTSLEFRATIATAVVCDSGHGTLVLAPALTEAPHLASVLSRPDVGDTLWFLTTSSGAESWTPRAIASVADSLTGCLLAGQSPWADGKRRSSILLRVASPLPGGSGLAIRVTRPWRYSLYRSSDGAWYLGAREWNSASLKFNIIQPVSGPFLSPASHGLVFRYFDSTGAVVSNGAADTHGIALIQVALRVDSLLPGKYAHAIAIPTQAVASVALRNRPK